MTSATTTGVTPTAPAAERTHVGWGDLLWLTWRQHRWLVLGTSAVVLGITALALGMAWHVDATGETHELPGRYGYTGTAQLLVSAPVLMGALIAVFWAAPLLSREYEQRTHLVVWSQDVTPLRWLTGKVVLLGAVAAGLSAGLGTALIKLMNSINAVETDYLMFRPFESAGFEAAPQVQVGYAVFGFALGLALSAVTRRTVLAMGLALVVFTVARAFVSGFWRPHFQEPLRRVEPFSERFAYRGRGDGADGTWTVRSGYSDAAGREVPFPQACARIESEGEYVRCLTDQGVHHFLDYHPADRLVPFQLFETAIFLALAAGLFALAFRWVRRARRV